MEQDYTIQCTPLDPESLLIEEGLKDKVRAAMLLNKIDKEHNISGKTGIPFNAGMKVPENDAAAGFLDEKASAEVIILPGSSNGVLVSELKAGKNITETEFPTFDVLLAKKKSEMTGPMLMLRIPFSIRRPSGSFHVDCCQLCFLSGDLFPDTWSSRHHLPQITHCALAARPGMQECFGQCHFICPWHRIQNIHILRWYRYHF